MSQRLIVIRHALRHDPRLILDYARWFLSNSSLSVTRHTVAEAVDHAEALREVAQILGPFEDGPAVDELRRWKRSSSADETAERAALAMSGDPSLGELAYACVRALRPRTVVETGVATGVTSAYVLAALEDNNYGELHSVDLPPTELYTSQQVGSEVPPELRHRWQYHWGDTRRLLPRVFAAHRGHVGVFIHDSNHQYASMRAELDQAIAELTTPGVVLADDVDANNAFADATQTLRSLYVGQRRKPGSTGIAFLIR